MNDAPRPVARWRVGLAVALLLIGLVVAFVPGLAAGDRFLGADLGGEYDAEIHVVASATFTAAPIGSNHYGFGGAPTNTVLTNDSFSTPLWTTFVNSVR